MNDEERTAWVQASIEARRLDSEKQTKFCPACGDRMLGGIPGDLSLLGCTRCGQRVAKYLLQ